MTTTNTAPLMTDDAMASWHRPQELASLLGVSRMTIYRWIDSGRLELRQPSPRVLLVKLRPDDSALRARKPATKPPAKKKR